MTKRYSVDRKKVREVYAKTAGRCFYCGCKLPSNTDILDDGGKIVITKRNWHVDHKIPVARGGGYEIKNLVPSCATCNRHKTTKTAEEFMA